MTPQEARVEIRRLKEHEAWLVERFMEELKKDKREIQRLRKLIREARKEEDTT